MKPALETAERELRSLADASPITRGMTIRVHRTHIYLGRPLASGPYSDDEPDDRVRLTHLGGARFGLSVHRHTGKWENTPYSGSLREVVDVVCTAMQHLVAADL
jgi:hypothetical protein